MILIFILYWFADYFCPRVHLIQLFNLYQNKIGMIPQQDENHRDVFSLMEQEEQSPSKYDYTSITKHAYLNKVFCWIQSGNSAEVKKFFDTFPHLLNNFNSPNNWNPFLYAVRYGNVQLIKYFKQKNMKTSTSGILSSYSVVHTAVYSGQADVLEYVLKNMDVTVNPTGCETSPLKVAMKANNPKMVQILVAKGAYYVFGDVFNNLYQKQNIEEQNKYWSLQTNREIAQSMVVEEAIIRDCPIKETLKYSRVKSIIGMKLLANKLHESIDVNLKFAPLAQILSKDQNVVMLLRMAVNKGDSILATKGVTGQPDNGQQI